MATVLAAGRGRGHVSVYSVSPLLFTYSSSSSISCFLSSANSSVVFFLTLDDIK